MNENLLKRIAKAEAQEELRRAGTMEFLKEKYQIACDEENEEDKKD